MKILRREEVLEKMELEFIEMDSGFHIAIDVTYIDQVGEFKLILPTGEILDTSKMPEYYATDKRGEESTSSSQKSKA